MCVYVCEGLVERCKDFSLKSIMVGGKYYRKPSSVSFEMGLVH